MPTETDKTYTVHLYATVRVPFKGIVAGSQKDAIQQAMESADMTALLDHPEYEYADEITSALVDEDGDSEHDRSTWYEHKEGWVVEDIQSDGRKLYVIEFLYADNNQLYQTFARLTNAELLLVDEYLNKLDENGDITMAGSSYTCEWSEINPHPSLEELAKEFAANSAFDGPREECGITLEVANVNNTI